MSAPRAAAPASRRADPSLHERPSLHARPSRHARAALASALYFGRVRHRRWQPHPHAFSYRVAFLYLDLDELPEALEGRLLWSARRPAFARFKREDYFGDPGKPLDETVRDRLERDLGFRPAGPIRLLTHPRYLGYVFNPVSFYYCFDEAGRRLEAILAEITNTPWGERHAYALDARRANAPLDARVARAHRFRFRKGFHVSPFLDMDYDYDWRFTLPGERLVVHMDNLRGGAKHFDATLGLTRRPLDGRGLARVLVAYPLMTLKVIGAIHWQAFRLWLKRTPFYTHPAKRVPRPE